MNLTPSDEFLDDPVFGGFDNNAAALTTTDRLANDYQRAAESVAEAVVANAAAMGAILPCTSADQACAEQFITEFGAKVYRRPISPTESSAYLAVYDVGDGAYEQGSAFEQGIRLVIEGMLHRRTSWAASRSPSGRAWRRCPSCPSTTMRSLHGWRSCSGTPLRPGAHGVAR